MEATKAEFPRYVKCVSGALTHGIAEFHANVGEFPNELDLIILNCNRSRRYGST